ncbi:sigma-54-dependent Fis family transcriptional regulator [Lampropedia puyangensis]|uniref:Sigma-54-dependent Fis family transcriptional regulator n=1 Tax=Lampropedia puyangensis TaxID=1330072 RepID=A0A4S8EV85_9BURK|nr:sigma-54-dependent Fis family transcriptional regulator [Lampropedia puyangensis]THT98779.1 sigma-54-dependent Fis family transcriptional regulator [Lampropedia puyangensis]
MPSQSHTAHIQEIEAFGQGYPTHAHERDRAVLSSWRRCIDHHQLDPAQTCEAYIVPEGQLRVHREESEPLIRIARSGLEHLYQQLKGLDYVLLLADRHGIAVDFLGHEAQAQDLRQAGLYLGAEWREDRAGTSAVGACLASGDALVVHQSDHFDFTHSQLSCTAAPIYDLHGELAAVLDLSLLQAPKERASQSLALNLVIAAARRVELANLMAQSRSDWVLRFAQSPDFLDVDPDAAISIDGRGRIRAMTHAGAHSLSTIAGIDWRQRHSLIGQPLEHFFDCDACHLPELRRNRAAQERILRARDGSIVFAHAMEPQRTVPRSPRAATQAGLNTGPNEHPPTTAPLTLPNVLETLHAGDTAIHALLLKAAKLAAQKLPILIQGETGAGKEYLARALHQCSGRTGAFIAINCAAIPEPLLESELFGYLPGTWTGGTSKGRHGLIEAAHGGTLFLDEIGDMPQGLQAKLLRVLSESCVTPLGAHEAKPVDIRVISASHRTLAHSVASGEFRQDLLYRLNAAELVLPPLRQRSDVLAMVERLLTQLSEQHNASHTDAQAAQPLHYTLSEAARIALQSYPWPGNLRELHNCLRYATALCDAPCCSPYWHQDQALGKGLALMATIDLQHLPETLQMSTAQSLNGGKVVAHSETTYPTSAQPSAWPRHLEGRASFSAQPAQELEQLLAQCQGNVSEVARILGVNRSTIHRRIQRLLGSRQVHWNRSEPH